MYLFSLLYSVYWSKLYAFSLIYDAKDFFFSLFYRRAQTIEWDAALSEWIYVVKQVKFEFYNSICCVSLTKSTLSYKIKVHNIYSHKSPNLMMMIYQWLRLLPKGR